MRMLRSLTVLALLLLPRPAAAQLVGGIEALFSNTQAITVSGNLACLNSSTVSTAAGGCGLYGFGLEVLINLAEADTAGGWGVEMALGYGQLAGFTSGNGALDLRGAIRQLPSLAVYASHARPMPLGLDQFNLSGPSVSIGYQFAIPQTQE